MITLFVTLILNYTVSIYTNRSDVTLYVDGREQILLDTSTDLNKRFITKKDDFILMAVSGKDTVIRQVVIKESPKVIAINFKD